MKKAKKFLRKRGELGVSEWIGFLPYIALTVAVMAGIFLLVGLFINLSVDVEPLQVEVFFNRVMYSPNSIMYTDNITGRVYPGVIDWKQFTNETLDKSMIYYYEKQISAKFELYNTQKDLIKTAYFNNLWYNRLAPLAESRIKGEGSAQIYVRKVPIIYRTNDVNRPGSLKVYMIIPN